MIPFVRLSLDPIQRDFGRTVLACISVFAEIAAQSKINSTQPQNNTASNKSYTFEISDVGIIV